MENADIHWKDEKTNNDAADTATILLVNNIVCIIEIIYVAMGSVFSVRELRDSQKTQNMSHDPRSQQNAEYDSVGQKHY